MTEDESADSPVQETYVADKAASTLFYDLIQFGVFYVLIEAGLLFWFSYAGLERQVAILENPRRDMTMGDQLMAFMLQIPIAFGALCFSISLISDAQRKAQMHDNIIKLRPAILLGAGLILLLSWLTILAWKTAMHL